MRVEEKQVCDLLLTDPIDGGKLIIVSNLSVNNDHFSFDTMNPKTRTKWRCSLKIEELREKDDEHTAREEWKKLCWGGE